MEVFVMPNNYGKGSIGTSMSLVRVRNGREVKKRPPRRCDCKKCVYAIINGECVNCYITGEVAVNEKYCYFFKTEDEVKNLKNGKTNPKQKYKRKRKAKSKKKYKKRGSIT